MATAPHLPAGHELLEREHVLESLSAALADAGMGRGKFVLVAGEAGIGKSAVIARFLEERVGRAQVLLGFCDALFTPRPLGPVLDIADVVGGELAALAETGARPYRVAEALVRELRRRAAPSIVVVEDLHWADEATLDVVRLVARRIDRVSCLVLVTYRDDELGGAHPLQLVLGDLASNRAVTRLKLEPLSPQAVAALAAASGVDAADLYRKTRGNPFFVTEALAAGGERIPDSVRDVVLARAARLSPPARTLLEAVAVVPVQAELWLLEALAGETVGHLDECLASGMLTSRWASIAFRHELARLAVQECLASDRALELHRRALESLAAHAGADIARLAHHAEAAGDADAVLRFAPAAGDRAASASAHREAAAQFRRALRFAGEAPARDRAGLLVRYAYESYLTGDHGEAIEARRQALALYRALGDLVAEGDQLRALSRLLALAGDDAAAEDAGRRAVEILTGAPPGRELAMAYSNAAQLRIRKSDWEEATRWGTKAAALAEQLGETDVLVHALTNLGNAGPATVERAAVGIAQLERSLTLALEAGLEEHAARAYGSLAYLLTWTRSYDAAGRLLDEGIDYAREHDLDAFRLTMVAQRACLALDRGDWSTAAEDAALVLREPLLERFTRFMALLVRARVRIRRGDPGSRGLEELRRLAEGDPASIWFLAVANAEAASLGGRRGDVAAATADAVDVARRTRDPRDVGELAYWRWRAGLRDELPLEVAEPYAADLAGDWRRAHALWTALRCPYEAALALTDADDDATLRRALAELQLLGARPAATMVARRLREHGARGLPRGPRPSTRRNPGGLTARELEVLDLLAEGLRTSEIAERLFLSARTVDNYVAAILRKLDVRTRGQACAEAARLGLLGHE